MIFEKYLTCQHLHVVLKLISSHRCSFPDFQTSFIAEKEVYNKSKCQLLAEMDVAMGGRVAEELVYGGEKVTTGEFCNFKASPLSQNAALYRSVFCTLSPGVWSSHHFMILFYIDIQEQYCRIIRIHSTPIIHPSYVSPHHDQMWCSSYMAMMDGPCAPCRHPDWLRRSSLFGACTCIQSCLDHFTQLSPLPTCSAFLNKCLSVSKVFYTKSYFGIQF